MQKVFVLDKNKQPLMPCLAARARELLHKKKAAVFKLHPFTIVLKDREKGDVENIEVKIDPGSKVSGIALVGNFQRGNALLFAANLEHRGQTKFNRVKQDYEKDHWIDAACAGKTGTSVHIAPSITPLLIKATGRGSRQFCRMDRYGFPRTSAKIQKSVHGFKTGDLVKAIVPKGTKMGTYYGRAAVRHSGNFRIDTSTGKIDGISYRYCRNLQRSDAYAYVLTKQKEEQRFLPVLKDEVSALSRG